MNSKTTPYDEDRNQKHIRLAEAYQKGNAEAAGKLLTDISSRFFESSPMIPSGRLSMRICPSSSH